MLLYRYFECLIDDLFRMTRKKVYRFSVSFHYLMNNFATICKLSVMILTNLGLKCRLSDQKYRQCLFISVVHKSLSYQHKFSITEISCYYMCIDLIVLNGLLCNHRSRKQRPCVTLSPKSLHHIKICCMRRKELSMYVYQYLYALSLRLIN